MASAGRAHSHSPVTHEPFPDRYSPIRDGTLGKAVLYRFPPGLPRAIERQVNEVCQQLPAHRLAFWQLFGNDGKPPEQNFYFDVQNHCNPARFRRIKPQGHTKSGYSDLLGVSRAGSSKVDRWYASIAIKDDPAWPAGHKQQRQLQNNGRMHSPIVAALAYDIEVRHRGLRRARRFNFDNQLWAYLWLSVRDRRTLHASILDVMRNKVPPERFNAVVQQHGPPGYPEVGEAEAAAAVSNGETGALHGPLVAPRNHAAMVTGVVAKEETASLSLSSGATSRVQAGAVVGRASGQDGDGEETADGDGEETADGDGDGDDDGEVSSPDPSRCSSPAHAHSPASGSGAQRSRAGSRNGGDMGDTRSGKRSVSHSSTGTGPTGAGAVAGESNANTAALRGWSAGSDASDPELNAASGGGVAVGSPVALAPPALRVAAATTGNRQQAGRQGRDKLVPASSPAEQRSLESVLGTSSCDSALGIISTSTCRRTTDEDAASGPNSQTGTLAPHLGHSNDTGFRTGGQARGGGVPSPVVALNAGTGASAWEGGSCGDRMVQMDRMYGWSDGVGSGGGVSGSHEASRDAQPLPAAQRARLDSAEEAVLALQMLSRQPHVDERDHTGADAGEPPTVGELSAWQHQHSMHQHRYGDVQYLQQEAMQRQQQYQMQMQMQYQMQMGGFMQGHSHWQRPDYRHPNQMWERSMFEQEGGGFSRSALAMQGNGYTEGYPPAGAVLGVGSHASGGMMVDVHPDRVAMQAAPIGVAAWYEHGPSVPEAYGYDSRGTYGVAPGDYDRESAARHGFIIPEAMQYIGNWHGEQHPSRVGTSEPGPPSSLPQLATLPARSTRALGAPTGATTSAAMATQDRSAQLHHPKASSWSKQLLLSVAASQAQAVTEADTCTVQAVTETGTSSVSIVDAAIPEQGDAVDSEPRSLPVQSGVSTDTDASEVDYLHEQGQGHSVAGDTRPRSQSHLLPRRPVHMSAASTDASADTWDPDSSQQTGAIHEVSPALGYRTAAEIDTWAESTRMQLERCAVDEAPPPSDHEGMPQVPGTRAVRIVAPVQLVRVRSQPMPGALSQRVGAGPASQDTQSADNGSTSGTSCGNSISGSDSQSAASSSSSSSDWIVQPQVDCARLLSHAQTPTGTPMTAPLVGGDAPSPATIPASQSSRSWGAYVEPRLVGAAACMESLLLCAPWDSHEEAMARARAVTSEARAGGGAGAAGAGFKSAPGNSTGADADASNGLVHAEGPLTWSMSGGRRVVLVIVRSPEASHGLRMLKNLGPALMERQTGRYAALRTPRPPGPFSASVCAATHGNGEMPTSSAIPLASQCKSLGQSPSYDRGGRQAASGNVSGPAAAMAVTVTANEPRVLLSPPVVPASDASDEQEAVTSQNSSARPAAAPSAHSSSSSSSAQTVALVPRGESPESLTSGEGGVSASTASMGSAGAVAAVAAQGIGQQQGVQKGGQEQAAGMSGSREMDDARDVRGMRSARAIVGRRPGLRIDVQAELTRTGMEAGAVDSPTGTRVDVGMVAPHIEEEEEEEEIEDIGRGGARGAGMSVSRAGGGPVVWLVVLRLGAVHYRHAEGWVRLVPDEGRGESTDGKIGGSREGWGQEWGWERAILGVEGQGQGLGYDAPMQLARGPMLSHARQAGTLVEGHARTIVPAGVASSTMRAVSVGRWGEGSSDGVIVEPAASAGKAGVPRSTVLAALQRTVHPRLFERSSRRTDFAVEPSGHQAPQAGSKRPSGGDSHRLSKRARTNRV